MQMECMKTGVTQSDCIVNLWRGDVGHCIGKVTLSMFLTRTAPGRRHGELEGMMGGAQRFSERDGEGESVCLCQEPNTGHPASCLVITELLRHLQTDWNGRGCLLVLRCACYSSCNKRTDART
jgi:hypothetical protein